MYTEAGMESNFEGEMPLLAACFSCANAESLRIKYDEKESIKQHPAAEDCQRYADCRQTCYDAIVLMPVTEDRSELPGTKQL